MSATGGKAFVIWLATIMVFRGVCGCMDAQAKDVPEIRPAKVRKPPKIDGVLDDICWRSAAEARNFVAKLENMPAEVQTEAYLLYDNETLYVGFRCAEPDVGGLKDDAPDFWGNDAVVVFVGPQHEGKPYYQLGVDLAGAKYERGHMPGRNIDIPGASQAAAQRGPSCWTAEIAIPFNALNAGEQMGRVWRLNLNRVRAQSKEHSTWAPVHGVWHNAECFGYLKGLIIGGQPEMPKVKLLDVTLAAPATGGNTAQIRLRSRKGVQIKVIAQVRSPNDELRRSSTEVGLKRRQVKTVTLPYDLPAVEGEHGLTLELVDANSAEVYYRSPKASLILPALLEAYFVRSYYTTEEQARLGITANLPVAMSGQTSMLVDLRDPDGKVLERKKLTGCRGDNLAEFAIAGLEPANYEAVAVLKDKTGASISRATARLIKLPANPGNEVKIDRWRRCVLVNGKPFFPIGGFYPKLDKLDALKAIGFNNLQTNQAFLGGRNNVGVFTQSLDKLRTADIRALCSLYHGLSVNTFKQNLAALEQLLQKTKNYPNILWYNTIDEVGALQKEAHDMIYFKAKEIDPYHPVGALFCQRASLFENYDLLGIDNYWAAGRPGAWSTPMRVVPLCREGSDLAKKKRLPFFVVQFAGNFSGALREPTDREQRLQTYLALIHGAKSIGWFHLGDGGVPNTRDHWLEICNLVKEMNALAPILVERSPEQIAVKRRGASSPIHILAKERQGKLYLLAANGFTTDIEAEVDLNGIVGQSTAAKVWFEDREVQLDGTRLRDRFGGYTTHVYELPLAGSAQQPYRMNVTSTDLDTEYDIDAYFTRKSVWHHPYRDSITIMGKSHTLASVAGDLGDEAVFDYDPATRTGTGKKFMYCLEKSELVIGDERDPARREVFRCGAFRTNGDLKIYNAKLVGDWAPGSSVASIIHLGEQGTLYARNVEFTRFRWLFAGRCTAPYMEKAVFEDCEIHGNEWATYDGARGVFRRCHIHDNDGFVCYSKEMFVRGQPLTFIDCRIHDHKKHRDMGRVNCVYINTTDDSLDKYEYTTGSLTFGWHLALKAVDRGGAPRKGLHVWLDAAGERSDRRGETDAQGVCKLDAVQYLRDKDGQEDIRYEVKISEDGQTWRTVKSQLPVQTNTDLLYRVDDASLEVARPAMAKDVT